MQAQTRRFSRAGVMLIGLALMLLSVVPAAKADLYNPADWSPMVWSDKADYAPGEQVTLSGAHWQPGETVHIRVNDDTGASWDRDVDVTADETGGIVDEFNLPNWFVAQYRVTATGASGAVATHTFTDADAVYDPTRVPASGNRNVTAGQSFTFDMAAGKQGGGSVQVPPGFNGSNVDVLAASAGQCTAGGAQLPDAWVRVASSTEQIKQGQWELPGNTNNKNFTFEVAVPSGAAAGAYKGVVKFVPANGGGGTGFALCVQVESAAPVMQDQTITFPAVNDRTYGDGDVQLDATASSGLPVSYSAAGACSVNADKVHISAAGSCTVTASQAGNAGFNAATPVNRSFTIAPRPITVTADALSKVYGDNDPALTYKVTSGSLVSGDSLSGSLTRAAGDTVAGSPYAIQPGTLSAGGNYALTFVGANLMITAKGVTGSFTAAGKVYDGTVVATISDRALDGVVGQDKVTLSGGTATFDSRNVGDRTVTLAGAELAGVDAGNYTLTSVATAPAKITRLDITGTFASADKVYDGTDAAAAADRALVGAVTGDKVSLSGGTAAFDSRNVGDRTVTLAGAELAGDDAGNYTLTSVATASAKITALALTGSFTADNKVYDGNREATVASTSLPGSVEGDDVELVVGDPQFDSKLVGTGKDVVGVLSLSGADAGNYTVNDSHTAKADITAKALTGSFTADNKVYDGTTGATVKSKSLPGAVEGGDVELVVSDPQFDSKLVGTGKDVTAGLGLQGADAGNYTVNGSHTAKADITAKAVTGSFKADDKVYDSTVAATISDRALDGVVGQDQVSLSGGTATFGDKNVGDRTVTLAGAELAGDDQGNYTLASVATAQAKITAKAVTGSFTAADKVYDGNRDATMTNRSLEGVLGTEDVTLTGGKAQFDTKDVGTGKTVTGTEFALDGEDKGNYVLSMSAAKASITSKSITGSFTAADKVYDGNRDATISGHSLVGAVDGDNVSLTGGTAQFDTKDVGTGKTVTGTGFALDGGDKGNYTLESVAGTTAKITPKSITGSFTAKDKLYDGNVAATITGRSLTGVIGNDDVALSGGSATFANAEVGQNKTVTGTGFELVGAANGNYGLASSTLTTTASITYGWDGFLQPINDTAHQTGVNQSKFKLGQTIPAKFVITDAAGASVKQAANPTFSRSANRGTCGVNLPVDTLTEVVAPTDSGTYAWDGSKYHYNWSSKGLTAGEYRIHANLADGTHPYVDICLTK